MNKELFNRIISSLILLPTVFVIFYEGSIILNFFLLICFIISIAEWNNLSKNFFVKFCGALFLFISFCSIFFIRNMTDFNLNIEYLMLILSVCICTDTGGFIFGKFFKGPKLTKISPNKTYSGVVGSFICPIVIISSLVVLFEKEQNIILLFNTNTYFLIFIIFISFVSQCGDLLISFFKRLSQKKDTGKIIPGHGGLLDRIDGMIFAFPFAYLAYYFFLL